MEQSRAQSAGAVIVAMFDQYDVGGRTVRLA